MSRAKLSMKPPAQSQPTPEEPAPAPVPTPTLKKTAATRTGTKLVAAHLPLSTWQRLRILTAQRNCTLQQLLEEAVTDILDKYRVV